MAKAQARYVCQACGATHGKWGGRCEACGAWNCITEEPQSLAPPGGLGGKGMGRSKGLELEGLSDRTESPPRRPAGLGEFDRVCGGGLVPGSAVLVGGDPGIGKSTLLLQVLAALSRGGPPDGPAGAIRCLYVSGEESTDQIRMRAQRMGLAGSSLDLAAATSVRDILGSLQSLGEPAVVVIDSIQTMFVDTIESAPGTVSQVRASAQELIRAAKERNLCLLLVSHVTKEGLIAGPKVLEHMVDAVLTFEGERGHQFRILRSVKNRYGATDEIGVFEMTTAGLTEVENPSALFLTEREGDVSGASVFAGIEGTRPLLVEIQALVSASPLATPRRAVVGWDSSRLAMVLAVLDARCGIALTGQEVYLNVAGGLKISEPAADMAVAAALLSAASGTPVPAQAVFFGEIGLSGEVRQVAQGELRLKEAAKLGFTKAFLPARRGRKTGPDEAAGIERVEIGHLRDLVALFDWSQASGPALVSDGGRN